MSKLLHLEASPRGDRSASITVAKHFIDAYRAAHPGDTVETLDLWQAGLPEFNGATIDAKYAIMHGKAFSSEQQQAIRHGTLDRGHAIKVVLLEPGGGEGSNRWYRLCAGGASGHEIRQLTERAGVTLVRLLRTRLGTLELPRALPRGHSRALSEPELELLLRG